MGIRARRVRKASRKIGLRSAVSARALKVLSVFGWSWLGTGAVTTFRGMQGVTSAYNPDFCHVRFSSQHTGIVNFALGDGSVRSLKIGSTADASAASRDNPTSDWSVFQAMAGRNDGQVFDAGQM